MGLGSKEEDSRSTLGVKTEDFEGSSVLKTLLTRREKRREWRDSLREVVGMEEAEVL